MVTETRTAILVAASSDIGTALARHWCARGWRLAGTYRTRSVAVDALEREGMALMPCDLADSASVDEVCGALRARIGAWDLLVLCPGTLEPVGPFLDTDMEAWEASVQVNLVSQLRVVHRLLPARRHGRVPEPGVLFFAGGGTNSAPMNASAYTLSKIALIKMCELLDAEMTDTRFMIAGPGMVQTKIHHATLRAGTRAGAIASRAADALAGRGCVPMARVLECCDWLADAPREAVSGRNISVASDAWGSDALLEALRDDPQLYKLRRHGNDRMMTRADTVAHAAR